MLSLFTSARRTYENVKDKWQTKTPKQKWQHIYNSANVVCEVIGIRILSDMKNYWYSASCGLVGGLYFSLLIYTAQYYFKRKEFTRVLECTCLIGMAVPVSFWHFCCRIGN